MNITLDLLRCLLKERGTVSAYDAARALMCRPEEVCAMASDDWWITEKIAGPEGFLYRLRPVISTTKRMAKEAALFDNSGITTKTNWRPA